jgi:hypothetical protein
VVDPADSQTLDLDVESRAQACSEAFQDRMVAHPMMSDMLGWVNVNFGYQAALETVAFANRQQDRRNAARPKIIVPAGVDQAP